MLIIVLILTLINVNSFNKGFKITVFVNKNIFDDNKNDNKYKSKYN